MPDDPDRVSPAGKKQQNAAKNPYRTPSKPAALQPDDGSTDFSAEDERRFYEKYRDRLRREQT